MPTAYLVRHQSNGRTHYVAGEDGTSLCPREAADLYPTRQEAQWAGQWAAEDTRRRHRWHGIGDGKPIVTIEPVEVEEHIDELCRLNPYA